jgi:hypothetical protein
MAVAVRDRGAKLVQEDKTREEAVAAKPTADFDARGRQRSRERPPLRDAGVHRIEADEHDAISKPQTPRSQIPNPNLIAWDLGFGFWDLGFGIYFKCLLTSFVISNMFTDDLPPNTAFNAASPLIIRLFFLSCSPFFLM